MKDLLELAKDLGPFVALVGGAMAVYVSLRFRPVLSRLRTLENRMATLEKSIGARWDRLEAEAHNYERWRGQVTKGLEVNDRDHQDIKDGLATINGTLLLMATEIGKGKDSK